MAEQENRSKQTYNADQYLITALFCAEWISAEYKTLADKHRNDPLAVRQIYLCACDKVPIDILRIASNTVSVEESLKKARQKYLEKKYSRAYADELHEIKSITNLLRKEVKNISGAVKHIADTMPSSEDTYFPSEPETETGNSVEENQANNNGTNVQEKMEKYQQQQKKEKNGIPKETLTDYAGIFWKLKANVKNIFDKKKDPIKFINELTAQDYSDEKIKFIISCFEEGLTEEQIRKFISPKLDIENMERLKNLYFKGDKQNGE